MLWEIEKPVKKRLQNSFKKFKKIDLRCRVLELVRVHVVVVVEAGLLPLRQTHRGNILVTKGLNTAAY